MDRQDIDALLIGALYGELTPADEARLTAHLDTHPGDRTAFDGLKGTRQQLLDSRIFQVQLEPPQSVSAMLLQEAHRRAPRVVDRGGESWFTRLTRSFLLHPAMAAAAMLVLVLGVAGTIYLRNGDNFAKQVAPSAAEHERVNAADPTAAGATGGALAPTTPPAVANVRQAGKAQDDNDGKADSEPQQADLRYRGGAAGSGASRDLERGREGEFKVGLDDTTRHGDAIDGVPARNAPRGAPEHRAAPDPSPRADVPTVDRPKPAVEPIAKSTSSGSYGKDLQVQKKGYVEVGTVDHQPKDLPDVSKAKARPAKEAGFADDGRTAAPSTGAGGGAANGQGQGPGAGAPTASAPPRKVALPAATATTTPTAQPPPPPVNSPKTVAKPQAPPQQAKSDPSSSAKADAPPADKSDAKLAAKNDKAAETKPPAKPVDANAWAKGQHARATQLARDGQCSDAAKLVVAIKNQAPDYYEQFVVTDRDLKGCKPYVDNASEKDAEKSGKSRAQKRVNADEPAPAPTQAK